MNFKSENGFAAVLIVIGDHQRERDRNNDLLAVRQDNHPLYLHVPRPISLDILELFPI